LKFLTNIEKFISLVFRKDIILISKLINKETFKTIQIGNKNIDFYIPSQNIIWRVKTLFSKEPETIDFINKFSNKKKIIFWDIGSNIGLYSIYAAVIHKNIEVISFEPSITNLRTLGLNISRNKLTKKIKIITNPLSDKTNCLSTMKETSSEEGSALNTFRENFDFQGKSFKSKLEYQLLGLSIDYLIKRKILEVPDYIKIDIDGLEHLVLRGAKTILSSNKIKKISIELNENFQSQYTEVLKVMKKNNFELQYNSKLNPIFFPKESLINKRSIKFQKTYNFHFTKKN
jgi:FkbM family methyltransferase